MPIILAIEPDRRQAAHLAGVVRHRVTAELIIADTTEGALDAIGNRVPDMVLVPALLSPQDDAALAAALRVIAAAAHVRTLTIPVLAVGQKRTTPGGMLAKWGFGRAASPEAEGCDPAVFAEQINAYLKEAAAERAELELAESDALDGARGIEATPVRDLRPAELSTPETYEPVMTEPVTIALPVVELVAVAPAVFEPPMLEPVMVEPLIVEPLMAEPLMAAPEMIEPETIEPAVAEPAMLEAAMDAAEMDEPVEVEFAIDEEIEPLAAESTDPWDMNLFEEPVFDLSEALDDISNGASKELFAGDSFGVYTIQSAVEEPAVEDVEAVEAYAALPLVEEESLPQPIAARVVEAARFEDADEAAPRQSDEPRRTDFESWVYLTPGRMWPPLEGMLAESPTPKAEHLEWAELVASLRQDLERRRTEPQPASVAPVAAAPPEVGEGRGNRPMNKQKHQARKSRAIQDEWGFFDPEQCGFSALLAKLEEITDAPGESDVRQPS